MFLAQKMFFHQPPPRQLVFRTLAISTALPYSTPDAQLTISPPMPHAQTKRQQRLQFKSPYPTDQSYSLAIRRQYPYIHRYPIKQKHHTSYPHYHHHPSCQSANYATPVALQLSTPTKSRSTTTAKPYYKEYETIPTAYGKSISQPHQKNNNTCATQSTHIRQSLTV
jgi:hypothetical protein